MSDEQIGDNIGATQMEVAVSTQDVRDVFNDDEDMPDAEPAAEPEAQPEAQSDAETEPPVEAAKEGDERTDDPPQPSAAAPGPPEKPDGGASGGALFGDEEEEEEPEEEEMADPSHEEVLIEDDDIVRIPLEVPRGQPDAGDKLMLVGLPTNVRLDTEIFEKEKCAEFEQKIVANSNTHELQELKRVLVGPEGTDIIRCKSEEPIPADLREVNLSKLHSTCKYVEFSDGSSALLIGQNAYTQIGSSDFSAVLLEVSQLPVMRVHGDLTQRRIYSFAPSASNMRKSSMR